MPISWATSRTVTRREALPARDRERRVDDRLAPILGRHPCHAAADYAGIAQLSNNRLPCAISGGARQGSEPVDDPDDALPRANERAQRDRPVGALVGPPGRPCATRCPRSSSTSRSGTRPACSTRRRCTSTGSPGRDAERYLGGRPRPRPARSASSARRSTRCGATTAASSSRTACCSTSPRTSTSSRPPSPTSRTSSRLAGQPRRLDRGRLEGLGDPVHPGPALPRHRRRGRAEGRRAGLLRRRAGQARGRARAALAHGLHRRPRVRDLGPGGGRAQGLGRGLEGQPRAGRDPVRDDRAVHGPHRGRPGPPRRRLPLEPVRLDGRRPLDADRARAGLDVPRPRAGHERAPAPRRRSATGRTAHRPRVHRRATRSGASSRTGRRAGSSPGSSSTGATTTGSTTPPA